MDEEEEEEVEEEEEEEENKAPPLLQNINKFDRQDSWVRIHAASSLLETGLVGGKLCCL